MLPLSILERMVVGRPGTPIELTITSSSQVSAELDPNVLYNVKGDDECYIAFGSAPTATSSSFWLTAGVDYPFVPQPGDKIAVIRKGTASGTLQITPMGAHE